MSRKKSRKKTDTTKHIRVVKAREQVNKAFAKYVEETSQDNQESLQNEKEHLKNCYNQVNEEDLDSLITKVEEADIRSQHAESWRLINKINGRKTTKKCIIKGRVNTTASAAGLITLRKFLVLNRSYRKGDRGGNFNYLL